MEIDIVLDAFQGQIRFSELLIFAVQHNDQLFLFELFCHNLALHPLTLVQKLLDLTLALLFVLCKSMLFFQQVRACASYTLFRLRILLLLITNFSFNFGSLFGDLVDFLFSHLQFVIQRLCLPLEMLYFCLQSHQRFSEEEFTIANTTSVPHFANLLDCTQMQSFRLLNLLRLISKGS